MDPIVDLNADGNGMVTLYRYGKTWRVNVVKWQCQPLPYQVPGNDVERDAQCEVRRYRDSR